MGEAGETGIELHLDGATRALLELVANALLPLQAWIGSKRFDPTLPPTNAEFVPWRDSKEGLNSSNTGVVPFLEALLREGAAAEPLWARWEALKVAPLAKSPLGDPRGWRAARGLLPDPKFGIVESQNVPLDPRGKPLHRLEFYRRALPLLRKAAEQSGVGANPTPEAVKAFVEELALGKCAAWPAESDVPSDAFLIQFTRDSLNALMGMRGFAAEPWSTALLLELGELRRVGNQFRVEDVRAAVEEFERLVARFSRLDGPTKKGKEADVG